MANTILDSGAANAGITLSGGNLTVTKSGVNYANVLSTTSKSSGKWYFEVTVNSQGGTISLSNGALVVSLSNSLPSASNIPGSTSIGMSWDNFNIPQLIFNNVQKNAVGGNAPNGTTVGIALDIGNEEIWFFLPGTSNWDASGTDNPVTNTGGSNASGYFNGAANAIFSSPLFACLSVYDSSNLTANFGAKPYKHPIPSGFLSWDAQTTTNMFFSG